jgi:hypothetical protein
MKTCFGRGDKSKKMWHFSTDGVKKGESSSNDDYDGACDGGGDNVECGDVGGNWCNKSPCTESDLHLMREIMHGMLIRGEDNKWFKCSDEFTTQEGHYGSNPKKICDSGGSRYCHRCHNEWAQESPPTRQLNV